MGSSASQTRSSPSVTSSKQQKAKTSDGLVIVLGNGDVKDPSSEIDGNDKSKMNTDDLETTKAADNNTDAGKNEVKKKKEPFTPEELEDFKEQKFEELKKTTNEVLALESIRNKDGEFDKVLRNATVKISNGYLSLTRANQEEIRKFRKAYSKMFNDLHLLNVYFEMITSTYKQGWHDEDGGKVDTIFAPFKRSLITLLNHSDASDDFANALADKPGYLEFSRQVLTDYQDRHLEVVEPALKPTEAIVLNNVLLILHNISMRESNVGRMRSVGFTTVLPPYLNSKVDTNALSVLAALAGIINEEECEIIDANKKTVEFLLKVLKNGLASERRRCRGWSTQECGLVIRILARNDNNKKLLVDLGALPLLVELGQTGNIDEQCESAGAIWALCFDKDIQTLVTTDADLGVIDMLVELKKTDNAKIKHACNGALWTLRDALKKSPIEKYKEIGETLAAQNDKRQKAEPSASKVEGHIMLSYQWANQETVKVIRDRIKESGYQVWMDIDMMGGSTLQAMADAVEGAVIFLMCYSNKYKNSPACRAEAEYAFQLRKKIIPLKMELGYHADGWLGFILGSKLFFEFSGKYPFEIKLNELLKEISSATASEVDGAREVEAKKSEVTHSAGAPVTSHAVNQSSRFSVAKVQSSVTTVSKVQSYMKTISAIRNWSTEETKNWIEANGLQNCTLNKMSGAEISFLAKMQMEAPEYFYRYLQETLKARDVTIMSKIVWALHDVCYE